VHDVATWNEAFGVCHVTSFQDVISRHMRMVSGAAVMLPGLDHAGIATQVCPAHPAIFISFPTAPRPQLLVERAAAAAGAPYAQPSSASRDQKIADAHKWSEKYGANIINQLKVQQLAHHGYFAFSHSWFQSLGVGADWSRVKFTLDASVCKAVSRLFVRLHRLTM
jgi:valyl-tRNA synthetase